MSLSTHVLDIAAGAPAAQIVVVLDSLCNGEWTRIHQAVTDANGRCGDLLPKQPERSVPATYRLRFETATYFAQQQQVSLYPHVDIIFTIADDRHHHIPLLLAANGYTTSRGS